MKRAGFVLLLLGDLGLAGFIVMDIVDSDNSYVAGWLTSAGILSLGCSFRAMGLPVKRRKKIAKVALITSLVMLCLYFIFKYNRYLGASFFPILFFDLFALVFLPIHTKNRIDKWKLYTRATWHAVLLAIADQISLGLVFGGLLCRVYHWPLANVFLFTGLVFLAVTVIAWNQLFSREIVLRKQAEEKVQDAFIELKEQHALIEEKNLEILASINYAKRLQDAILPSEKIWKQSLPDSFVFYRPKDIVAGDFYWMEKTGDLILFAAADCTGHGVPGALVSVVCSNALNRAVKEFGITEPGEILDKVRTLVIETFEKSENEIKDGMDISLCSLNVVTHALKWSGANNPLWIVTDKSAPELQEIKADKQPIGKYAAETNFITHSFSLNKGNMIYLFTDGYADQFGGPLGKKFKYKQLKDLLFEMNDLPLTAQELRLSDTLFQWKQDLEQVDDICVIGVRI